MTPQLFELNFFLYICNSPRRGLDALEGSLPVVAGQLAELCASIAFLHRSGVCYPLDFLQRGGVYVDEDGMVKLNIEGLWGE